MRFGLTSALKPGKIPTRDELCCVAERFPVLKPFERYSSALPEPDRSVFLHGLTFYLYLCDPR